jgi:predicted site-specific integrase-resolvase
MLLSVQAIALQLGVHPQTIRRWDRTGQLPADARTLGGHRRYRSRAAVEGETVGYVRVSSHDQKEDLARQHTAVVAGAVAAGKPCDRVISDLGSGMNYQKRGFVLLLGLLLAGKVKTLVLAYKDRLLRFGAEIVFRICQAMGTEVLILKQEEQLEPQQRFCNDVIEVMTVFCSKIYGQRGHANRARRLAQSTAAQPPHAQLCSAF